MRANRFVVGLAGLLLGTAASQARAQSVLAWSYTMNITTDSGNGRPPSSMAMRYHVSDRFLRMEMLQLSGMSSDMSAAEGSYTLLDAVDSTMTSVMPSQRMAMLMAMPSLADNMRAMHMRMNSDTKSSIEDLGAGGRIMGHDTHHYRMTTTGSLEISFGGTTCAMPADAVNDMWIAPDVDILPAAQAMMRHFGAAAQDFFTQGGDTPPKMPHGTALRSIGRRTIRDKQGTAHTVTTTMEYSGITHGPLNAELFAVPSGYTTTDMRKTVAKMPAGLMDSLTAAAASAGADHLCGR
jgi:hypothetical protein